MMKDVLETERLLLRPWREDDAADLYAVAKDPEVAFPTGWLPHTSVENSREIIKKVLMVEGNYAITVKGEDKAIGCLGYKKPSASLACEKDIEIGFWIGKAYWGHGYVPEAAKELIRQAFVDLGYEAVWCCYYEGNEKSKRCQEKLGFKYHHTEKDVYNHLINEMITRVYSRITKEEWMASR